MLQASVRDFAADKIAPLAESADEKETLPDGHFAALAEMGLLGITADEEYGGAGMGCVAASIAMEEIGKVCASTALSYLAHSMLVVHNLNVNGSKEQKAKYLPDLIAAKKIAGLGISEPESGSDALSLSTKAEKKGKDYQLTGTKMWITNAPIGDVFYLYAKTGPGKKDLSTFIVEKEFAGFSRGKKIRKMGMRGSPTGELIFENCQVPGDNLVGKEGDSVKHMMRNLDIERITIAAISVGLAEAAVQIATKYATERKQFDQPIANFQMIQKMIADGAAYTSSASSVVFEAAKRYDLAIAEGRQLGKEEAFWAAKAKLVAAETATKVCLDAVQVLGGYGYSREFPVERMARDAKLVEIGAGTNEVMRLIIAKQLIEQVS